MATNCWRCREYEKQIYWEDVKKHQFFKVMMDDFRLRMRIPEKFVMNLKDKLLGKKVLRGPSGNTWLVEIIRNTDDDYFFCNGWEVFVKDHHLEDADLLVFRINESASSFDVMIFDPSACEKEETFFVKKHQHPCKHPAERSSEQESSEDEDSSDQESFQYDGGLHGKVYMFRSPESRRGKLKKIMMAKCDDTIVQNISSDEDSLDFVNLCEDYKGKNQQNRTHGRVKDANRKRKCILSSQCKRNNESVEITSDKRQVTVKERIRVRQLASRHKSCMPCVMMKIKPTHANRGQLKLPRRWVNKYMRKQSETISLRIPSSGKTWAAELRYRKEGLVIQTGFADFVMDNYLEEEDICVFELAQGRNNSFKPVVFDVHIYRVTSESIDLM